MKKSLNKTKHIILFLIVLCTSCSEKSKIESIFTTNKNEYWEYTNYCLDIKGIFFHYNKNGSTNKYFLHIDNKFSIFDNDEKVRTRPILWSIKNDSTFVYEDSEYKIEKITDKEILLSYYHYKIKNKKCFVKLSKWVDGPEGPRPLNGTYKPEE